MCPCQRNMYVPLRSARECPFRKGIARTFSGTVKVFFTSWDPPQRGVSGHVFWGVGSQRPISGRFEKNSPHPRPPTDVLTHVRGYKECARVVQHTHEPPCSVRLTSPPHSLLLYRRGSPFKELGAVVRKRGDTGSPQIHVQVIN